MLRHMVYVIHKSIIFVTRPFI